MRNPECTACPLHASAKTVCVWGEGDSPCDLLFIGEAPGKEEDLAGRPFVGRSGKLLRGTVDGLMAELGLDHLQVRYTNAVRCRPPKNRTPHARELNACRSYLHQEIEAVSPHLLVLVGASAAQSLLGAKLTLRDDRHKMWYVDVGDTSYPARLIYHPAAVLRSPALGVYFQGDIELCLREVHP